MRRKNVTSSTEEDASSEINAKKYTRWKNVNPTWKEDAAWGGVARMCIEQERK